MLVLLGLQAGNTFAQEVRGVVKDKSGETLPGVSVLIVGTTDGVSTDIDGNFVLRVDNVNNDVLRFSFIGMKSQEIALNGKTELVVVLEDETTTLDEVVVVGYGTQKRSDLTGAVASVSGQVLSQIPVTSAAEAITGRMAGVQVTTTEGSPDADVKIRVRSGGSISQDNSPLFIVDGFPVSSISNIPPTDIQSIDVLKDASSTAIYGARGANGVVIVTTKSGTEGKITVNFNAYWGVKVKKKSIGVLSPYEYVLYQHELDPTSDNGSTSTFNTYYGDYHDLNIYRSIKGTDWQDEVFGRHALQQNYNVSISGGTKASRYNLSLTHTDEDNIMITSGFKRSNINFKLNSEINKYVSIDFNTRVSYTIVDGAGTASDRTGASSKLRNAVKYAPTKGLRDFSDSTIADDDINNPESASLLYDPIESVVDEYKKQKRISSNFNGAINIKPMQNLTIRSEWGYAIHNNRTDYVWGPATYVSRQYAGQPVGRIYTYEGNDWRTANTITWQKDDIFAGHNINVMLGQEITSAYGKSVTNESRYFPHGLDPKKVLAMFNLGTPIATDSQSNAKENLSSFFGRLNYNILDRYLFTVTFRADGSSKFSKDNRWGFFRQQLLRGVSQKNLSCMTIQNDCLTSNYV
ncbi:MAG: SusC/RagA family TonB-linked outer membrane protein [Odoribacter sp.]|nr:SusC/RagA family TonB-linked outer membrane protein [Odoribacter sp.]